MAEPYREGKGWAFRLRMSGQDIYRAGFPTQSAALKARNALAADLDRAGRAAGDGPHKSTLASAFSMYALSRLPYLKGADRDANRINRYLRAAGLPVIRLAPREVDHGSDVRSTCYWSVWLEAETQRVVVPSLRNHRGTLAASKPRTEAERVRLANMRFADIAPHHVQALIDAMQADGYSAASIEHERAELRRLFAFARKTWQWTRPHTNPASPVKAPKVDNARDRVLTNAEWAAMAEALSRSGNPYVLPLVCLMLETAMRSCEPLTYARWEDVDWDRRVLRLPDAKCGHRDVPLNPGAITVLSALAERESGRKAEGAIFPTTYEAAKKAWAVARKACGVSDVNLHDLRHTAGTRYSLEYQGNLPVIMLITGHKTVKMVMRYINLKADDVVRMMHDEAVDVSTAPAGYQRALCRKASGGVLMPPVALDPCAMASMSQAANVIHVAFPRRTA